MRFDRIPDEALNFVACLTKAQLVRSKPPQVTAPPWSQALAKTSLEDIIVSQSPGVNSIHPTKHYPPSAIPCRVPAHGTNGEGLSSRSGRVGSSDTTEADVHCPVKSLYIGPEGGRLVDAELRWGALFELGCRRIFFFF